MILRLKQLRNSKGISQQKLADLLGVSQSAVNSYENGINEPDIAMLIKFAEYFETSVDYIIGYSERPNRAEKVTECHLNETELSHMKNYRGLPKTLRADIDALMRDIANISR